MGVLITRVETPLVMTLNDASLSKKAFWQLDIIA